ncbi:hypothetical protein F4V58_06630 [Corynebacterium phocae]|uniref:hypothetical protein n=1 Tax=Corynebacterium phocae TaxID=161895 RepID=UPI00128A3B7E|nr:hypothetical protein [Corynebacterium phocae]KAA8723002.1 hypothetical protein F4V58_06630 [Corynebacterium phocae]
MELTPETSLGYALIDFAENELGLELRPWQRWLFIHALELDTSTIPGHDDFNPDTPPERYFDYRFRQVCVLVARQNGKTLVMCILGLWRLFYDGASEMISTAQNLSVAEDTLADAFAMARRNPEMAAFLPYRMERGRWVPYMRTANGSNRIELARIPQDLAGVLDVAATMPAWYVVANNGGGRSYSADLAMLDEVREHKTNAMWAAVQPTTAERPRNQIWCFSNAGTAESVVLRRLRNVALKALESGETDSERLMLAEWSAAPERDIFDRAGWCEANPSLGYGNRTESDMLALARSSVDPEEEDASPDDFRTEYLCQWVESLEPGKITEAVWAAAADETMSVDIGAQPVFVGVDVSPEGKSAAISVSWQRPDGAWGIELVAARSGYDWVPDWLNARRETWFDGRVAMQVRGCPAAALAPLVENAGIEVVEWQGANMTGSVLGFVNSLRAGEILHSGRSPESPDMETRLEAAAVGVRDKKLGDVFIWNRDKSVGDPCPLIAANQAWWLGHQGRVDSAYSAESWDGAGVGDEFDEIPVDFDDDGLMIF